MKFKYQYPDETIMLMCEGNPGALTAMLNLHKAAFGEDPQHGQWPWEMVKICDELEIYGSRLYMLWSDCLDKDCSKMAELAKLYRAGTVTADFIREQIKGSGYRGYKFNPADLAGPKPVDPVDPGTEVACHD